MLMAILINTSVDYTINQMYMIRRSWSGEDVNNMDESH